VQPSAVRDDGPVARDTIERFDTAPPPRSQARAQGFSFAPLWAEADRDTARQVEAALAAGDAAAAIRVCDILVSRLLASAAGLTGNADAPRDPGLVVALLGIDGKRYLVFRMTVRVARAEEPVALAIALEAYAFAIDVRRALATVGG
jgi:hypothetical protein